MATSSSSAAPVPSEPQDVPTERRLKPDEYRDAADPARYRKPDAPLFTCRVHGDAVVLCTTAGKTGRNGTTATVGATLLWLTCPYLNNVVARLERHGAVQAVRRIFLSHPDMARAHEASHAVFEERAKSLLEPAQWAFFNTHFLEPSDARLRKYGNAAVSHPQDMKCLHALVAQFLGGADNIIGRLTAAYICHLHSLLPQSVVEPSQVESAPTVGAKRNAASRDETAEEAAIKTRIDDVAAFEAFLVSQWSSVGTERAPLSRVQDLSPDLCECARRVVAFMDGRDPRLRKKHRVN